MRETVTIERLGHRGDGMARSPQGPIHVPFALAGERVVIERHGKRGRIVDILQESKARQAPVCHHFGTCGGCALQHMQDRAYLDWKRQRVADALALRNIECAIDPVVRLDKARRRRAVFSAAWKGGRMVVGFHARLSHELIAICECPVLHPEIVAALGGLAEIASVIAARRGELRIAITRTGGGLDVGISAARPISGAVAARLAALSRRQRLARLCVNGEPVATLHPPLIDIGGIAVMPPSGGFLQASAESEAALAELVIGAVGDSRHVADLFCGIGTFSLRLARKAAIHAVDADEPALAALRQGWRGVPGLKPVTTERRDLLHRPVPSGELARFDAVLFDPPRAGAAAQSRELAASRLDRVIALSCNPDSFARDAAILIGSGFRLVRVTPVDQFLHSPHVELFADFVRH